nr:unnamed protein product [Spirometra erinaceieuropaei]
MSIVTLTETRFSEQGQPEEIGVGCTFFWSRPPTVEGRAAGIVFAIPNGIVRRLLCLQQSINDRLITLQLSLQGSKSATIATAYDPSSPMNSPDQVKKKSYEDLKLLLSTLPRTYKLLVLGDLSARVGTDHTFWEVVLRYHEIGCFLLQACAKQDLLLTNIFRLPMCEKTTAMHSRSRQ